MNVEGDIMCRRSITREQAAEIAGDHIRKDKKDFTIYEELPAGCNVYYHEPKGKCWYLMCSFDSRGTVGVGSSRLIIVSRETGRVLYDGAVGE